MPDDDLDAELDRLRADSERLERRGERPVAREVSEKGGSRRVDRRAATSRRWTAMMSARRKGWLAAGVIAACLLAGGVARAFCRTSTCPLPPGFFATSLNGCTPPNFDALCASMRPPNLAQPLWWRNACVSYDLQASASRQVDYPTAARLMALAFSQWTAATCPPGGGSAARVSIDVVDLGPVQCGSLDYSTNGNQHVILFHDDVWPHADAANTLGLTTMTFDVNTGEIYDADMELNATVPLSVGDPVPPLGYDLLSIVTHEAGHFLGMAHATDARSSMFAYYQPGTIGKRILTDDDLSGVCSIYPPDQTRTVGPSVSPGGRIAEDACDPTPRHGFTPVCGSTARTSGCSVGPRTRADSGAAVGIASLLVLGLGARRRTRPARRRVSGVAPSAWRTQGAVA